MTYPFTKILLALLISAIPTLAAAVEPPVADKPVAPVVAAAPLTAGSEATKPRQTLRLGYVDIGRINTESNLGKASLAQGKEKQQQFQTQLEAKGKQLEKQKKALEAKLPSLTPPQRETKAREFQKKVEEFQKFGQGAERELLALQQSLAKALYEAIEQAAIGYGKANGLSLVVIKRELLYLADGVDAQDVTEGILKSMNQKGVQK